MFAHIVDRHDGRVIQIGGRLRFLAKATHIFRRRKPTTENHFQGDRAVERGVLGLVDGSHATSRDFVEQFVIAEGLLRVHPDLRPVAGIAAGSGGLVGNRQCDVGFIRRRVGIDGRVVGIGHGLILHHVGYFETIS